MWICEKPGLGGCKVVWEFGNFWLGRGGSLNFGDFARWAVLLYLDYISIVVHPSETSIWTILDSES